MFTVPPFVAGTVLRLRREAAEQLEGKARELEEERELLTELTVRRERVRIAAELHDIVGHTISVMVIQAAAGQRLVDTSPDRARETLVAIAESAAQGREDLERLIELLGGHDVVAQDLTLVDEVVERAARSGLDVTYRLEGEADALPASVAHLAFRVVQESLTNALRHAPGAEVRICVRAVGAAADVRVENGVARSAAVPGVSGTGRGLVGLGERIDELGGFVRAGATPGGGWLVEARIGR
nr:histidine kinase [Cellulomonas sp. JH27-2]